MSIKIRLLGTGAGGGLPQWNCLCLNCSKCRSNLIPERTQSSICVSSDDENWVLINASPDFRQQFNSMGIASCSIDSKENIDKPRNKCMTNVILMDSQLDHVTGLLSMRETPEITIYSTQNVLDELTNEFRLLPILSHYQKINNVIIDNMTEFTIFDIVFRSVYLKGKPPPYSKNRLAQKEGDNMGLLMRHNESTKYAFYAPGIQKLPNYVLSLIHGSFITLIDGTLYKDDEMIVRGYSKKTGKEMGHIANEDLLSVIVDYSRQMNYIEKSIYLIHINNTNPILDICSDEYKKLKDAGINVSSDGMEFIV